MSTTTDSETTTRSIKKYLTVSERENHLQPWLMRQKVLDILLITDPVLVFLSFIVAETLYTSLLNAPLIGGSYHIVAGLTAVSVYIIARSDRKKYDPARMPAIGRVLLNLATAFMVVIVIGYGLKEAEIHSRLWFALSFVIAFVLVLVKNWTVRLLAATDALGAAVAERIAIFGDLTLATSLRRSLMRELGNLCVVTTYEGPGVDGTALDRLISDGLANRLDRVVFCLRSEDAHRLKDFVEAICYLPVKIEASIAHDEFHDLREQLLVNRDHLLIDLDDRPQGDWRALLKRVIDVVAGFLMLLAVAPILGLAALAIKWESKGPVFFRQRRHGWNHSVFTVWKLRTMTVQEDGDKIVQATRNDARVTRVGSFLRKTSIDELPQLLNVLSGEMSLVGPRPHALAHNLQYSELIKCYAIRHKVRPGLTGWAQVKGLRGNSENIADMVSRAEADVWYIQNWSLLLDLKIILMTPFALLLHRNAY